MASAAIVVGAGVSGLTTALCLADSGVEVKVVTADEPRATTSAAAGAMWGPYLVEPRDRVREWSIRTLAELRVLAGQPDSGVRVRSGTEASRTSIEAPEWTDMLDDFRPCEPWELPIGFTAGWHYSAPLVDMPTYLQYLAGRLAAAGVRVEIDRVASLRALAEDWPVVVNCTGVAAHDLVPDDTMQPIRGQLVVTDNPGIEGFFTEATGLSPDLCHIYPHGETLVLGGTAEPGRWDREPDLDTARRILDRCRQIDSRVADANVIEHRVGLRPTTPAIQLHAERLENGALLIHNYGHGGAGVSLSWGCAHDVAEQVVQLSRS